MRRLRTFGGLEAHFAYIDAHFSAPPARHFAQHPQKRQWCVCAEAAVAASAHTHHWNEVFSLGKLPKIKIPISLPRPASEIDRASADVSHVIDQKLISSTVLHQGSLYRNRIIRP